MSTKPKVYVTRPDIPQVGFDILKTECDVKSWTSEVPVPRSELLKEIEDVEALFCVLTDKVDKEVLDKAHKLKTIATMSTGYDHIDLEECKKRGIKVGYTPEVLTDATAELTVGLLLATSRRLIEANKEVYNGGWKAWAPTWMCGKGLKDSTVGVYGFGRIGQEVAKRIVPFKPAEIIYSSRSEKSIPDFGVPVKRVPFNDLLGQSDFLIITCALTPETTEIFNAEAFDKMKNTAILINSARGGVVDQTALYNALKNKKILAAGLDVMTPEPLPVTDPLAQLSNVVLLPHIGSADINTRIDMARITAKNILNALKGEKLLYEI